MEKKQKSSVELIEMYYRKNYSIVVRYMATRIPHEYEAEDLAQDVFVRLLNYQQMLCEETIHSFVFTIARNLVIDILRNHYRHQDYTTYIYDTMDFREENTNETILYDDLVDHVQMRLSTFPIQRRKVYTLSLFADKSIAEISTVLSIAYKTVENHLFLGRKNMREYLMKCI